MATTVLKRLLDQRPCFGTFVKLGRPEIVDICALAGFDFVICDMEHAQMTEIEARSVIRACVAADLPVVVRLPEPEQGVVNRLLEAGAQGIQLPRLTSAEQSRRVRAMLHFPPAGRRSVGNANPLAGYGTVPLTSYMDQANDRALVVGQFETRAIDEPPDQMFEQLDVAFIGGTDLSVDFGVPGQADAAAVRSRMREIEECAFRHGRVLGTATTDMERTRAALDAGYRFLAVSGDIGLLVGAATTLVDRLREAAAEPAEAGERHEP